MVIFFTKLGQELKENWAKYFLELLIIVVFGGLIFWKISSSLDSSNVDVRCEIEYIGELSSQSNYSLNVYFYNPTNLPAKSFYLYIWRFDPSSWGTDYSVSEHCRKIEELEVDFKSRFKIFCDYIPPKTEFDFGIRTNLNKKIFERK